MNTLATHPNSKFILSLFTAFSLLVLSTGCSQSGQFPSIAIDGNNDTSSVTPPTDSGSGTDNGNSSGSGDSGGTAYKMEALAWETSSHPERTAWSQYLQKIILEDWNTLLAGADDMDTFCPTYDKLDNNQRANVWAQLIVGMTKYESGYDPTSRYKESTMGTDPITGEAVYSEGLLQLSYQDTRSYTFCKFDWNVDKNLSRTDPKKTILDPYLNLDCGVGILAKQIKNKGLITVGSGAYWAVLKSTGSHPRITEISAIVKSLSICK